jgi:drug/metabolite transporter (DMT)-like permease
MVFLASGLLPREEYRQTVSANAMWLLFAFIGPVAWATSTHIDKYLVDRYFQDSDTAVLIVFTSFVGVVVLPFIWLFRPDVFALPLPAVAVMTVSGLLYMGAMLFYLRAIQSEEASVVAPLFQTSTIFTFALAYLLLGETLRWIAVAGVALILLGVLSLSAGGLHTNRVRMRTVVLMLSCTFILAFASVIFKFYAVRDDFWPTTFWTFVGEAIFGAGILAVPQYRHQFAQLLRTNTGALLGVNGANELINLGGGLGVRYASLLAPVALVSAVASTTTLFVFAFGTLLTLFAPRLSHEELSAANLLRKAVAATVVTAGVYLAGQG